jgi:adenylate cyclase
MIRRGRRAEGRERAAASRGGRGLETTVARFELARVNEEQVLAESSLQGERRVSTVRLVLLVLFSTSQALIGRVSGEMVSDRGRGLAVLLYTLFALFAWVILRKQGPNVRRSEWFPIPTTLADVGFMTFMGWRGYEVTGRFDAGMSAAYGAVIVVYSVARYSRLHVLFSTVLVSVAYTFLRWHTDTFSPAGVSFVVGAYMGLGLLIARTNAAVSGMFLGLRRRDNLSRFLPRQVVDRVLNQGDVSLAPVQRPVTILFSDIRDFTALSETLQPKEVLELLDEYFGHMSQIVMAHEGLVNKFLGDGMLACWGVPDHSEDHAQRAMRAALDMRAKLVELNAQRATRGQPALRIGIGLHTGMVAAGMLGGAEQHEYTVIGDAVNLASRVEGLTKVLGLDILVSESTWRQGGEGRFVGERVSEEQVRGRREAVVVYSLKGRAPSQAEAESEARVRSRSAS